MRISGRRDQAAHRPEGGGRSRGSRAITLFRRGDLAFFVYGFAKSNRENLRPNELEAFRKLADEMSRLSVADLGRRLGEWDDYRRDMP